MEKVYKTITLSSGGNETLEYLMSIKNKSSGEVIEELLIAEGEKNAEAIALLKKARESLQ